MAVELIASTDGTRQTNDLIVLLNDANTALYRKLLLLRDTDTAINTAPGLERAVLAGIKAKNASLMDTFMSPVDAGYLVSLGRLSDADRASGVKAKSARERLDRYIVLRYASVDAARKAQAKLAKGDPSVLSATHNVTSVTSAYTPNDPYYASTGSGMPLRQYQWGLQAMNFAAAWDVVLGHGQIGVLEIGWPGNPPPLGGALIVEPHPDLKKNNRPQFAPWRPVRTRLGGEYNVHATHVGGILSAESNNAQSIGGTTGACINCSITYFPYGNNSLLGSDLLGTLASTVNALVAMYDNGVTTVNWSGSTAEAGVNCAVYSSNSPLCDALEMLAAHEVLIVESAGNFMKLVANQNSPLNLASTYPILPVAGTQSLAHARWVYDAANGSNHAGPYGVAAPAKDIVSTVNASQVLGTQPFVKCGDTVGSDESGDRFANGYGDAVGTCTGTSMAAPFVSALTGLVRSINPLLTANQTRSIIQQSGHLAASPTAELGYGVPNALAAVNAAIATNPRRLTPLFSFYSPERSDSFYTTVPQEGTVALDGSLRPYVWLAGETPLGTGHGAYGSAYGQLLAGYGSFPHLLTGAAGPSALDVNPRAEVWLFTTHTNPKSTTTALEPVYRMSWKCGDSTPYAPAVCSSVPKHIDTVLVNTSELAYFKSLGYQVDGMQGYVYPKSLPQPTGTVRLMRSYNAQRDDHAVYPDTKSSSMAGQGYIYTTNSSDWLGYVYPNTTGQVPVIQ